MAVEPTQPTLVTAAVLIIGNEILSGRTQDTNLAYLAKKLNEYGIVWGSTVITLTAGAGRWDGGVSLEQPVASAAAQTTATATDESSDLVIVLTYLDYQ